MKKIIIFAGLFLTQIAFAHSEGVQLGQPVEANLSVEFYRNLMPGITVPGDDRARDNRVFSVIAVVNFCKNVTEDDFVVVASKVQSGNLLQLYSADENMVDCFGPTREQTLRFSMPQDADNELPFYFTKRAAIINTGNVY